MLHTLQGNVLSALNNQETTAQLEQGAVILLPEFSFQLTPQEQILYSDSLLNGSSKNISYDVAKQRLSGMNQNDSHRALIEQMMARYVLYAQNLVYHLFPHYRHEIKTARTSFRPAEISGRVAASYRKDDTRLHVDAFPATPNQGMRLLRVFCNINPAKKPRVWRIGEPFPQVLEQFSSRLKLPFAAKKYLLKMLCITQSLRTNYDALMLQLHDSMKADLNYQKNAQQQVELPAHSTWIVFTDQVSHAALAGQFCLEQTFLLPVAAMQEPQTSPLRILEQAWRIALV